MIALWSDKISRDGTGVEGAFDMWRIVSENQIRVFSEARVIMTLHGSNLDQRLSIVTFKEDEGVIDSDVSEVDVLHIPCILGRPPSPVW